MSSAPPLPQPASGGKFPWIPVLAGCGIVSLLAVAAVCAAGMFLAKQAEPREGVRVKVEAPVEMKVGDEGEVVVTVWNDRDQGIEVGDVDFADGYMAGFTVVSTDPEPKTRQAVSMLELQSFTYDRTVPAGQSATFRFKLKARAEGLHRGDVDVYEGLSAVTQVAETMVVAP